MKSTGIVRKLDQLGRVVLPIELRKTLNINEKDPLEIYVDGESIILSKYEPACIFCSSVKDNVTFKGKIICADCVGLREFSVFESSMSMNSRDLLKNGNSNFILPKYT